MPWCKCTFNPFESEMTQHTLWNSNRYTYNCVTLSEFITHRQVVIMINHHTHMHTCTHIHSKPPFVHNLFSLSGSLSHSPLHTHIRTRMHARTHIHTYIHIHIYTHKQTIHTKHTHNTRTQDTYNTHNTHTTHTTHTHTHTHTNTHIHAPTHTCTRTHPHPHTHTYSPRGPLSPMIPPTFVFQFQILAFFLALTCHLVFFYFFSFSSSPDTLTSTLIS